MTTAFATEKKFYNETLLHTEKGMKLLRESVALQKEWNAYQQGTDVSMGTYGVKLNLIHKNLQPKMKKIEIVPIGLNSQCHTNAEVFTKCGYTSQVGFNLLACPCGRKQTYEIHSVNKKDGKYYDFTKDFNNEKSKYFLELDTEAKAIDMIREFGRDNIAINRGCKCNITWTRVDGVDDKTQSEFMELIEEMENF
jgi:hypothetical protein